MLAFLLDDDDGGLGAVYFLIGRPKSSSSGGSDVMLAVLVLVSVLVVGFLSAAGISWAGGIGADGPLLASIDNELVFFCCGGL